MKRMLFAIILLLASTLASAQITIDRWMQPDNGQARSFKDPGTGVTYTSAHGEPVKMPPAASQTAQANGWHIAFNTNESVTYTVNGMHGDVELTCTYVPGCVSLQGGTYTGPVSIMTGAVGAKLWLGIRNTELGDAAADSIDTKSQYLQVGGLEDGVATSAYWSIGLGRLLGQGTSSPALLAYHQTDDTVFGSGDVSIATRSTSTDALPTEKFFVRANGDINAAVGYTPVNPLSLTTKNYVDTAIAGVSGGGGFTPGFDQVLADATSSIAKLQGYGDFYILSGAARTLNIASIASLQAAGAKKGWIWWLVNGSSSTITVNSADTMYGDFTNATKQGIIRPNQIVWFMLDSPGIWRAYNLVTGLHPALINPPTGTTNIAAQQMPPGSTISPNTPSTLNIPAVGALGYRDGDSFTVLSYGKPGSDVNVNLNENCWMASTKDPGYVGVKTVLVKPSQAVRFVWSQSGHWYAYVTSGTPNY